MNEPWKSNYGHFYSALDILRTGHPHTFYTTLGGRTALSPASPTRLVYALTQCILYSVSVDHSCTYTPNTASHPIPPPRSTQTRKPAHDSWRDHSFRHGATHPLPSSRLARFTCSHLHPHTRSMSMNYRARGRDVCLFFFSCCCFRWECISLLLVWVFVLGSGLGLFFWVSAFVLGLVWVWVWRLLGSFSCQVSPLLLLHFTHSKQSIHLCNTKPPLQQ